MSHRIRVFAGIAAAAVLAFAASVFATSYRVEISNLRVNLQGIVVADVVLKTPPIPRLGTVGGKVQVEFKVGTTVETVDVTGLAAVNVKRTATSMTPFP